VKPLKSQAHAATPSGNRRRDGVSAHREDGSPADFEEIASKMLRIMSRLLWVLRSGRTVDLPHHSIRLLNRLRTEPVTMMTAALEMHLSKPAASAAVARMEQVGFVRRDRDPTDGRRVILRLTETGDAVAGELHAGVVERLVAIISEFDDQELDALSRGFSALDAAVNPVDQKRSRA
jgi:DNA-binding MarR family transcriptional regulator